MDPDQSAQMCRLVWIHAGRKRTMLVLSWRSSFIVVLLWFMAMETLILYLNMKIDAVKNLSYIGNHFTWVHYFLRCFNFLFLFSFLYRKRNAKFWQRLKMGWMLSLAPPKRRRLFLRHTYQTPLNCVMHYGTCTNLEML
jgi:hypothetical protein